MAFGVWSPSLIDVVLFVIAAVVVWKLERRRRGWATGRLPPGSEGLPLVGETLQLIAAYKSENPEPFIDERVRRHGRLFTTHVFGERTVFSADPEFNRMVLGAEDRTVEGSYPSSLSTLLGTHSLVVMKGARHKRMHSLTLARLTSPAAIREAKLLLHIDRLVRRTLHSWPSSSPVLLLDEAKKITFELTVKQLVSYDQRNWIESLRREYLLLINGFFSIPFPSFLSFTTFGRALKARKKVEEALKEVIRKRKLEKTTTGIDVDVKESQNNTKKKDMLEELLEGEAEGMTDEAIVDFLLSLLVAGYETTSTIMTLAVKFLTDHPRALAQLREEQEGIRKKKKDEEAALDWDEYKSMPFTQYVINETLRVVNIIGGVFRRAKTDLHFKGRQARALSTPISACFSMSLESSLQGTRFPRGARSSSPSVLSTSTPSTSTTPGPSTPGDGRRMRQRSRSAGPPFTPPSAAARGCAPAMSSLGWSYPSSSITSSLDSIGRRRRKIGWCSSPPRGLSRAIPSTSGGARRKKEHESHQHCSGNHVIVPS